MDLTNHLVAAGRHWSARVAGALLLSLLVFSGAQADVDLATERQVAKGLQQKAITVEAERQGVVVYAVDGDYRRGALALRQEVSQRYFSRYRDEVDYLIVFTDFEFEMEDASAFATVVKNEVQGIGLPVFDHSAAFGSGGRLQVYVDMAAVGSWSFDPVSPAFVSLQNVAAHELMHRFGSYLRYRRSGVDTTDLLGRDAAHWNFFLDSDGSVMYGSDWQPNADGFTAVAVNQRYSPLDLYAAGFRSASEVPPTVLIRNGVGAAATDLPRLGFSTSGEPEEIRIEQIIDAMGSRVPDATAAQKHFRAGLVLLLRPGQGLVEDHPADLRRFARALETRFAAMTEGRGTLAIANVPRNASPGGMPLTLTPSGPCQGCPLDAQRAKDWILARQTSTGAVPDQAGSTYPATAAAVRVMQDLRFGPINQIERAGTFLRNSPRNADDAFALTQSGFVTPGQADLHETAAQWIARASVGQGGLLEFGQSPLEVARILAADAAGTLTLTSERRAELWNLLRLQQNSDGSFGASGGGVGHLTTTASILKVLVSAFDHTSLDIQQAAVAWLIAQRQPNGGFGLEGSNLATGLSVQALVSADPSQANNLAPTMTFLGSRQGIDGEWSGSVLATANVLQAVELLNATDLRFGAAGILIEPASPMVGDTINVRATVTNVGREVGSVQLQWMNGLPDSGGTPIGAPVALPPMARNETRTIHLELPNVRPAGSRTLSAVLDPGQQINELDESNNVATTTFEVAPLPLVPDAVLLRADLTVTPPSVNNYPATITVAGRIRNAGGAPIDAMPVRIIQRLNDVWTERARTAVNIGADQDAPLSLSFPLNQGDPLQFTIQADPDNALAEIRETNNELVFSLATEHQLDLTLTPGDLTVLTVPAIRGQGAEVRVRIRNAGFLDSPSFDVVGRLTLAGEAITLPPIRLQVPAQQTRERVLAIPQLAATGTASLRVTVDEVQETNDIDRSNNEAAVTFEVVEATAPNLRIPSGGMTLSPAELVQGQGALAEVRVLNAGAAFPGPISVLLESGAENGPRTVLGTAVLAEGLAAGAEQVVSIAVAELLEAGPRYFFATVDPDNQITESNDQDNTAFLTRTVRSLPDLMVSAASIRLTPTNPTLGTEVRAEITVRNLGNQSAGPIALQLAEASASTSAPVPGVPVIESLAGNASQTVTVTWTLGLIPGVDRLTLAVDPSNQIRESREDNNQAMTSLVTASDSSVDEPYFSPNGDGIQDRTVARFAGLSGSPDRIVVVDGQNRIIRNFGADTWTVGSGIAVLWDGRTDEGVIAVDGDYRIRALNDAGEVLREASTTLDTNRSPILEALDTELGRFGELPEYLSISLPDRFSADHNLAIVYGMKNLETPQPDDRLRGLYRFDLLTERLAPVLDEHWIQTQGARATIQTFALVGPGDHVLVAVQPDENVNRVELWRARTDVRNSAVRLISDMPGYPQFASFDRDHAVMVSMVAGEVRVSEIAIASGQVRALNADGVNSTAIVTVTESGVLLSGRREYGWFVSRANGVPSREILGGSPDSWIHAWSNEGVLIQERLAGLESLRWVRFADGFSTTLGSETNPGNGCAWSIESVPGEDRAVALNSRLRQALIVDLDDGRARRIQLPALPRTGPYVPAAVIAGDEELFDVALDAVEPMRYTACPLAYPNAPAPVSKRGAADTFPADGHAGIRFDFVRSETGSVRALLVLGEQIRTRNLSQPSASPRDFLAAGELFELDLTSGAFERLSGMTAWPLELPVDQQEFPMVQAVTDEEMLQEQSVVDLLNFGAAQSGVRLEHPALILSDGTVMTPDGRGGFFVRLPGGGILRTADRDWTAGAIFPDERHVQFGRAYYSSLANLSASLHIEPTVAGWVITGVAADRNFLSSELEWSAASAPEAWYPLGGASPIPSVGGELITWSPPDAGQYRVRLTVRDRAGNRRSVLANGYSTRSADLVDVVFANTTFSPNGDQVKDQFELRARSQRPVSMAVTVKSATGAIVRTEDWTIPGVGPVLWSWDGRDQLGTTVPDGHYRIAFGDLLARNVIVDTTPPAATMTFKAPAEEFEGILKADRAEPIKPYLVADDQVRSVLHWVALDATPTRWQLKRRGAIVAQHQGMLRESTQVVDAGDAAPFVLEAEDAAGNQLLTTLDDPGLEGRLLAVFSGASIPGLDELAFADVRTAWDLNLNASHAYPLGDDGAVFTAYAPPPNTQSAGIRANHTDELVLDIWLKSDVSVQSVSVASETGPAVVVRRLEQTGRFLRVVAQIDSSDPGASAWNSLVLVPELLMSDGARIRIERATFISSSYGLLYIGKITDPQSDAWTQFGLPEDEFFAAQEDGYFLAWFEDQFAEPAIDRSFWASPRPGNILAVAGHAFLVRIPTGCFEFLATATDANYRQAEVQLYGCEVRVEHTVRPQFKQCGAQGSDIVDLDAAAVFPNEGDRVSRFVVRAGMSGLGELPIVVDLQNANTPFQCADRRCRMPTQAFDVSSYPEGTLALVFQIFDDNGGVYSAHSRLTIDRSPATINDAALGPDKRMCLNARAVQDAWSLRPATPLSATDPDAHFWAAARLSPIPPETVADLTLPPPAQYYNGNSGTEGWLFGRAGKAVRIDRDWRIGQPYPRDPDGVAVPVPPMSGPAALRIATASSVGTLTCRDVDVFVDTNVSARVVDMPRIVFNPRRLPDGGNAEIRFGVDEAVRMRAEVRRFEDTGNWHLVEQGTSWTEGVRTYAWSGRLPDGSIADDGKYVVRVTLTDDCGFESEFVRLVRVDSMPPEVTFNRPAPNAAVTDPVVPVSVTVTDATGGLGTLQRYELTAIAEIAFPLQARSVEAPVFYNVNASWNRGTRTGPARFRFLAVDAAGNETVVEQAIDLQPRLSPFFDDARLEPSLVSPNQDGRSDATQVNYALSRSGLFSLRLLDAEQNGLADLESPSPRIAGGHQFAWAGEGIPTGGGDGLYWLELAAQDAANSSDREVVRLPIMVDRTPPELIVEPAAGSFIGASTAVRVSVRDQHFRDGQWQMGSRTGTLQAGDNTIALGNEFDDGRYALELRARDRADNESTLVRALDVDRIAPTAMLSSPESGAVLGGTATQASIRGTASDANLAEWILTLTDPAQPAEPIELARGDDNRVDSDLAVLALERPDGTYTLTLRVRDEAGQESTAETTVTIDRTPPEVEIAAPVSGAWIQNVLTVQGAVRDAHLREYRVQWADPDAAAAGQWRDLSTGDRPVPQGILASVSLPDPDGAYVLRVWAVDRVGLQQDVQRPVRLDATAPPVPLDLVATLEGADVRLDWTAVNAADLAGYRVFRDGEQLGTALVVGMQLRDLQAPEGTLRYQVSAVDQAGNESARSPIATVVIDRTPPEVALYTPVDGDTLGGTVSVTGRAYAADDFARYRLWIEPAAPAGAAVLLTESADPLPAGELFVLDSSGLAQGSQHHLRLEAEDVRGNRAEAVVTFTVDREGPAAPLNLTATALGPDADLAWTASPEPDVLGYLLFRNGQAVNAADGLPSDLRTLALMATSYRDLALPDGSHAWWVHAIDRAGNLSPPSNTVTLNFARRAPLVAFLAPNEGARFEDRIRIAARSPDLDVVSVRYEVRPQGSTDWQALASNLTVAPYEYFWDPAPQPFGAYEIRALARDRDDLETETPPIVTVDYRDLTPPGPAAQLQARGLGADIEVRWTAPPDTDVAAYVVEYAAEHAGFDDWQEFEETSDTQIQRAMPNGTYRFRVAAVDASGNLGPWSAPDTGVVYAVDLTPPFSPVRNATTALSGRVVRSGDLQVRQGDDGQGTLLAQRVVQEGQSFLFEGLPLPLGEHAFAVQQTDEDNNVSRLAVVRVVRGDPPSAPVGLQLSAADHDLTLSWSPNPEPDLWGYRVFRRGTPVLPDEAILPAQVSSTVGWNADAAFDGLPETAWLEGRYFPEGAITGAMTIDFGTTRWISQIELDWLAGGVPARYRVEALTPAGTVILEDVEAGTPHHVVALAEPYATQRIRVSLLASAFAGSSIALSEMRIQHRPLQTDTQFQETVLDGRHRYQVSAVSTLGFESARSEVVTIDIGDVQPPDPVVLTAEASGSDAQLTWTPSVSPDVAQYEIWREGTRIASVAVPTTEYVDAARPNGTDTWWIVAVDGFGNDSVPSNAVSLSFAVSPPGAPVATVTAPPEGGALQVRWQPGSGPVPVRYRLSRGLAAAGPYTLVTETPAQEWRDAPLTNGTTYWYTVIALDAAGNASSASQPVSGTPLDAEGPAMPVVTFPVRADQTIPFGTRATQIAGQAGPDEQISVRVAGQLTTTTSARVDRLARVGGFGLGEDTVLSPSGTAAAMYDTVYTFAQGLGPTGITVPTERRLPGIDRVTGAVLDGRFLARRSADGAWMLLDPTAPAAQQVLELPRSDVRALALRPDGLMAIARTGEDAAAQLHVFDLATGASRTLANIPVPIGALREVVFAAEAPWALLKDDAGGLWRIQLQQGNARLMAPQVMGDNFGFTEDLAIVLIEPDAGQGQRVIRIAANETRSDLGVATRLSVSPTGDRLAVTDDLGVLRLLEADTGALVRAITLSDGPIFNLVWTPSMRLFWVDGNSGVGVLDLAGSFRTGTQPLPIGPVAVSARATDASGQSSGESSPGTLEVQGGTVLPDWVVSAAQILVNPAAGEVGQAFTAQVQVRNLGQAHAMATVLRVARITPDGATQSLGELPVPALASGGSASLLVDLGVLAEAGTHQLQVRVDPEDVFEESSETNNAALKTILVAVQAVPVLDLTLSPALVAPDGVLSGATRVTAIGARFSGSVQRRLETRSGEFVADLGVQVIEQLAPGTAHTLPLSWSAAQSLAQDYAVLAVLRNQSGQEVARQRVPFTVITHRTLSLQVSANTPVIAAGDTLRIQAPYAFSRGNALIENAAVAIRIVDALGHERFQSQRALGTLLPGSAGAVSAAWLAGGADGLLTVHAELKGGAEVLARAQMTVLLIPAGGAVSVAGAIEPEGQPFYAGGPARIGFRMTAAASEPMPVQALRLRVFNETLTEVLAETQVSGTVQASAALVGVLALAPDALAIGNHVAILDARWGDTPAFRVLANRSLQMRDGLPPVIQIRAPIADGWVRSPADLAAQVVDAHSGVDQVDMALDEAGYLPSGPRLDGTYGRTETGLTEGLHALRVRARDRAGNWAESDVLRFQVDNTAPVIEITGVVDGERRNAAVTPIVVITDAHMAMESITLNGMPFASGTSVTEDGEYVLAARATDLAGNESRRTLRFSVDMTPPALVFVEPAEGAEIDAALVDVRLSTEADAWVRLTVGPYLAEARADAAGAVQFASVPLVLGANTLEARAEDALGNESLPVTRTVTRIDTTQAPLVGALTPAAAQVPAGQDIVAHWQVTNPATMARPGLALELAATHGASGTALPVQTAVVDVGAGATAQGSVTWSTQGRPLGTYGLVLRAQVDGQWVQLASSSVGVIDAQPPTVNVLQPLPDAWFRTPVRIAAIALDDLGPIEEVAYALSAAPFVPMTLADAGASRFESDDLDLPDGSYGVRVRVRDGAANQTESALIAFSVDRTPPVIQISQVVDGSAYAVPVTPLVAFVEANLASTSVTLDGQPFVSGTTLTADGAYVLQATAEDRAGNRTEQAITFSIDRTPPVIAWIFPAAGAILGTPQTDVGGLTEPNVAVELRTSGQTSQTTADAQGGFVMPAVQLVEGANVLEIRARDALGNVSPWLPRTVHYRPNLGATLSATLSVTPSSVPLGDPAQAQWIVRNIGTGAVTNLPIRVRLLRLADQATVDTHDALISLPAGGQTNGAHAFATTATAPGAHVVVLEATVPDAQGQDVVQLLASQTVDVRDVMPPTVSILVPGEGQVVPGAMAIEASATDLHGSVALVQGLAPGIGPVTLKPQANDRYIGTLVAVSEGDLDLTVRADDSAGNQGSATRRVRVDLAPPVIEIADVIEGGLYRTPVTPTISVQDITLVSQEITLDGQPYSVGTPITSDGPHELLVTARDALAQTSSRRVRFTIDQTAPIVVIQQPQDNAVVFSDNVGVLGSTEALATVALRVGAFTQQVTADAQGTFQLASVPLVPGINEIRASATDRAGNVGPEAIVRVERRGLPTVELQGDISLTVGQWPNGSALTVPVRVQNTGTADVTNVPIRLAVTHGNGQALAEQQFSLSLLAGGEDQRNLVFDTVDWGLGAITLRLSAQLPQRGSVTVLDQHKLTLIDQEAPVLTVQAPRVGERIPVGYALQATAQDRLSLMRAVRWWIDEAPARPMTLVDATEGRYAAVLHEVPLGPHTFSWQAEDMAGNVSPIVRVPVQVVGVLPLSILEPASGSTASEPMITIRGQTAAFADVRLRVHGMDRVTRADSAGGFRFDQVPVQSGANTYVLRAQDAFGNESAELTLVVRGIGGATVQPVPILSGFTALLLALLVMLGGWFASRPGARP